MMDSPFFRDHWNATSHPRYSPSVRAIPVLRQTTPSPKAAPKVVSIPVHFVGLERTRSVSAAKIQKVFRGFLVRKSVKRILATRREVDEIERRISRSDVVDLIRKDPKERLKVNETLMALLFRLDSVHGVDAGVRDCRKAVIKKAIGLQEIVDAIVAGDETLSTLEGTETSDQSREDSTEDSNGLAEAVDQTPEIKEIFECSVNCENARNQSEETQGNASDVRDLANFVDDCRSPDNAINQNGELQDTVEAMPELSDDGADNCLNLQHHVEAAPTTDVSEVMQEGMDENHDVQVLLNSVEMPHIDCEKMVLAEVGVDSGTKENEQLPISQRIVENHVVTPPLSECMEENVETNPTDKQSNSVENQSESVVNWQSLIEGGGENSSEKQDEVIESLQQNRAEGNSKECLGARVKDGNKHSRDLLERMMEDNEKLMGLMTELYEKNAMQARLLTSLSQRVEQLERAFMCERLRRRKKRCSAGTADGVDASPDPKKCGKR